MNENTGLKICPFCGGEAQFHRCFMSGTEYWQVSCNKCGCNTRLEKVSGEYAAKERVAAMWNSRVNKNGDPCDPCY